MCDLYSKVLNQDKIYLYKLFLFIFTILGTAACEKHPNIQPHAIFGPLGIEVSGLPKKVPVKLYDSSGKLVLSYPPLPSHALLLIFPWKTGETYRLVAGKASFKLKSPDSYPVSEIEVFAPLGSPGKRLLIYNNKNKTTLSLRFVILSKDICPKIGFLITSFVSKLSVNFQSFNYRYVLNGEFDRLFLQHNVCLAPDIPKKIKINIGRKQLLLSFKRKNVDLKGQVRLISWHLPTEESGYSLRYRKDGILVVPNPLFEHLGYILGIKDKGYSRYTPFAYQTLVFKNLTGYSLNLLIKADFLDPKTGKPVSGFYPPRFGMSGHFKKPLALAYLPSYSKTKVVLPIYIRGISPGEYLAEVKVFPLGEKEPILVKTRRIGVTCGSPLLAAGLLTIIFIGIIYTSVILLRLKHIVSYFSLRELTLIALAGAVAFGLDFLGGLMSNILYALLGPFNILIGGLITEIIHYAVFTAVLILVPKPGFATLSGLLHYLMGLVLFGGLRATDPFFLGTRLFILEICLFLFQIYKKPLSWRTIIALSLADALHTVSSLVLHMTFYRLFFPDWYLWLSILIKGFLYTFIGAYLGVYMGKYLLEIER